MRFFSLLLLKTNSTKLGVSVGKSTHTLITHLNTHLHTHKNKQKILIHCGQKKSANFTVE